MDKNLLLYIKDLRVFYILSKKLKENGIRRTILENSSSLSYRPSVIVSDKSGISEIMDSPEFSDVKHLYTFINYNDFPNYNSLLISIVKSLRGIESFKIFTIGIDPGQASVGVAFFLDHNLLLTQLYNENNSLIEAMNLFILVLKPEIVKIKIGAGNLRSLRDLLRLLLGFNSDYNLDKKVNIHIELVDESGSSKRNNLKNHNRKNKRRGYKRVLSSHEIAAMTIGIREGRRLTLEGIKKILNREPHQSELKHIQRVSRKKSSGKYSLSRELANDVYSGKISMDSAIKSYQNKKSAKESKDNAEQIKNPK